MKVQGLAANVDPVQRVFVTTMRRLPEEVQLDTIKKLLLILADQGTEFEERYTKAYEALKGKP